MRCDDEIARRGVEADDSWALTVSGEKLIFLRPDPKAIHLEDIAQQLSLPAINALSNGVALGDKVAELLNEVTQ